MLLNNKVDEIVEVICQKGCQAVRDDIALLKCGKKPVETDGLNRVERKVVYRELKSIMAVYGEACRVDGKVKISSLKRKRIVNDYPTSRFSGKLNQTSPYNNNANKITILNPK